MRRWFHSSWVDVGDARRARDRMRQDFRQDDADPAGNEGLNYRSGLCGCCGIQVQVAARPLEQRPAAERRWEVEHARVGSRVRRVDYGFADEVYGGKWTSSLNFPVTSHWRCHSLPFKVT